MTQTLEEAPLMFPGETPDEAFARLVGGIQDTDPMSEPWPSSPVDQLADLPLFNETAEQMPIEWTSFRSDKLIPPLAEPSIELFERVLHGLRHMDDEPVVQPQPPAKAELPDTQEDSRVALRRLLADQRNLGPQTEIRVVPVETKPKKPAEKTSDTTAAAVGSVVIRSDTIPDDLEFKPFFTTAHDDVDTAFFADTEKLQGRHRKEAQPGRLRRIGIRLGAIGLGAAGLYAGVEVLLHKLGR